MNIHTRAPSIDAIDPSRLLRVGQWLEQQVEVNRLAGGSVLVGHRGECAYFHAAGIAGVESLSPQLNSDGAQTGASRAFTRDTVVRLYSMTKPVTSVAAMMLYEQGKFQLDDPIARYLPAFADMQVWSGDGQLTTPEQLQRHTTPAQSLISVRQLLNHTSGLTYSFMQASPVDQLYRDRGVVFPGAPLSLEAMVDKLAQLPLLCQPGTQWNYSVASDVLGRLIEVWSGQTLSDFFENQIFAPLSMHSTGFHVKPKDVPHFADLYGPAAGGELGSVAAAASGAVPDCANSALAPPIALDVRASSSFLNAPALYSGGGGLVGSIDDYARFCQCLLNGGQLDNVRLLGRKSVEYMRKNHLPGNRDIASMGQATWSETSYHGIGFGLGFAVVLDPVLAGIMSSAGEHHWGGAASTFFWIDPAEELYAILLTQLYPSSSYPLRTELRTAVYQAL